MYENGSESAENATVIDFAALILASVSGARCARAISGSRPAKKSTSREERFTQHLAPCLDRVLEATQPDVHRRDDLPAASIVGTLLQMGLHLRH